MPWYVCILFDFPCCVCVFRFCGRISFVTSVRAFCDGFFVSRFFNYLWTAASFLSTLQYILTNCNTHCMTLYSRQPSCRQHCSTLHHTAKHVFESHFDRYLFPAIHTLGCLLIDFLFCISRPSLSATLPFQHTVRIILQHIVEG